MSGQEAVQPMWRKNTFDPRVFGTMRDVFLITQQLFVFETLPNIDPCQSDWKLPKFSTGSEKMT